MFTQYRQLCVKVGAYHNGAVLVSIAYKLHLNLINKQISSLYRGKVILLNITENIKLVPSCFTALNYGHNN
jgi:hypothetical protein